MTNASVSSAAFRALAAWLAIYVIISQLCVIPKWISSSKEALEVVEVVDNNSDVEQKANALREQEQRIQLVQRLMHDAKEVEARHEQVVASTVQRLERLREHVMKPLSRGEEAKEPTLASPDLSFFKELMELATLSDVEEARLLELSRKMQREVDAIVSNNATVSWSEVNAIVTARYQRRDPTRECPPPHFIDPSLARESHLFQKFQQAEKILKQRAEAVPPLLQQEKVLQELHEQALNPPPAPETTDTHDANNRMCVSQQDVVDMMDEGINALQRRLDLRRVLTKYVLATFDINKTDLILDAPLDPPSQPSLRVRDTINLRQVLDTPLLKEMEQWVDVALDHVGGHFDTLDQLVDKVAAEDTSVGRALISKLQTLAGKVEVPNTWSKVPSKAGMLRPGE